MPFHAFSMTTSILNKHLTKLLIDHCGFCFVFMPHLLECFLIQYIMRSNTQLHFELCHQVHCGCVQCKVCRSSVTGWMSRASPLLVFFFSFLSPFPSTGTPLLLMRAGVKQADLRRRLVSPGWAAVLAVMRATRSPRVVTFNLLFTEYLLREILTSDLTSELRILQLDCYLNLQNWGSIL